VRDLPDGFEIDAEFRSYIPAMSDEELRQLTENIKSDGRIRDRLIVWPENGTKIVVDGHNRIDVWRNTEVPFPDVEDKNFLDREAALDWIILNQLGRRNLSDHDRSMLRGRLYNRTKKSAGQPSENAPLCANTEHAKTRTTTKGAAKKVAAATKSSEGTVRRDGAYVEAIDVIRKVNAKAAADIESGAMKVPKKDVILIGKLSDIPAALKNLRMDRAWNDDGKPKEEIADEDVPFGQPEIPAKLQPIFDQCPAFRSLIKRLGDIKGEIGKLAETDGGARINFSRVQADLENVRRDIRFAAPHKPCPYCRKRANPSCGSCKGLSWVTEEAWKLIPEDKR
jgi:hypothetical protein